MCLYARLTILVLTIGPLISTYKLFGTHCEWWHPTLTLLTIYEKVNHAIVVRSLRMYSTIWRYCTKCALYHINIEDLYTPSSELFKELNWQTFPERVTYQKALLMYRIITNICPDYLKETISYILLTYNVETLDLLTVTNYIRQNLTANFSASHSCTLELPSGVLSPYMLKMQLRLKLLNLYI